MGNRYKHIPLPPKQELERLYFKDKLNQTEVGKEFGVSQKVVWSWFKKLGIKARVPKKRNQSGENNDSWKGNNAGYAAFHIRVQKVRGKADHCEVCKKGRYFEWANLTGKFEDVSDYKMMCKSCHAKYDKKINNITKK